MRHFCDFQTPWYVFYLMRLPCNRVCLLARIRREGLKSSSPPNELSTRRCGGGCLRLRGWGLGLLCPPNDGLGLGGGRLKGLGGLDSRRRNPPNPPPPRMRFSRESNMLPDPEVGGLEPPPEPPNVEAKVCWAGFSPVSVETIPSRPGMSDCSAIASHIMRSMHRNWS